MVLDRVAALCPLLEELALDVSSVPSHSAIRSRGGVVWPSLNTLLLTHQGDMPSTVLFDSVSRPTPPT